MNKLSVFSVHLVSFDQFIMIRITTLEKFPHASSQSSLAFSPLLGNCSDFFFLSID